MSQSAILICNMALSTIGANTISDLNEGSAESKLCSLFYDHAVETTLADFSWPFASTHLALAQKTENLSNHHYCYGLPFDCLVAREIARRSGLDDLIPFSVGNQGNERVLYTDQKEAVLVYTARITDPTLFPPGFVSAVSLRLASLIVVQLTQNLSIAAQVSRGYQNALIAAQTAASQENEPEKRTEAQWVSRRTGRQLAGNVR